MAGEIEGRGRDEIGAGLHLADQARLEIGLHLVVSEWSERIDNVVAAVVESHRLPFNNRVAQHQCLPPERDQLRVEVKPFDA